MLPDRSRTITLCLLGLLSVSCLAAAPRQEGKKVAATQSAWNDLANTDEATSGRALLALAATPKETVALLKARLKPVKVEAARVRKLIAQLDDEEFDKREEASAELQYLDRFAKPHLRKALESEKSIEVRRLGDLLKRFPDENEAKPALGGRNIPVSTRNGKIDIVIDGKCLDLESMAKPVPAPGPNPLWLRAVRASVLLERIGTPEAVALLKALADGEPGAKPTDEAKAALERLKKE